MQWYTIRQLGFPLLLLAILANASAGGMSGIFDDDPEIEERDLAIPPDESRVSYTY